MYLYLLWMYSDLFFSGIVKGLFYWEFNLDFCMGELKCIYIFETSETVKIVKKREIEKREKKITEVKENIKIVINVSKTN